VRSLLFVVALTAAFFSPGVVIAVLTTNELVYAFTYTSVQDIYARDSKNPAEAIDPADRMGSGTSHYHGSLTDKGTMTVHIERQQNDGGLIVAISEQGENLREAPPATCVVYGNTRVICDPNKTVYPEEYTLLRFLGTNFVDPSRLDANRHWALTQSSATLDVKAEYTVKSIANGIMKIVENRHVRPVGGGSQTIDAQTDVGYDFNRTIPTSVDEYVTQRLDNGVSGTTTTIYQTTLTLVGSTSTAEPASPEHP
jgi:hypothetical protein